MSMFFIRLFFQCPFIFKNGSRRLWRYYQFEFGVFYLKILLFITLDAKRIDKVSI